MEWRNSGRPEVGSVRAKQDTDANGPSCCSFAAAPRAQGRLAPGSALAQDVLRDAADLSTWSSTAPGPILDPLERTSEILFGVIMVLSFTSSISVVESGHAETREVLVAALGCNVAWGIVDAAFYLMAIYVERARKLMMLRAVRESREPGVAHGVIHAALPSAVSAVLTPSEVESLHQRLRQIPEPTGALLERRDLAGALGVFFLVFLSTLPIVIPFVVISDPAVAMRASNGIAILMLFGMGWSLGTHAGRPGWRTGVIMVVFGLLLVAVTIALGG
jgi:VIT1/CCC1 family predicted Fe2+/Mn2+ transporter